MEFEKLSVNDVDILEERDKKIIEELHKDVEDLCEIQRELLEIFYQQDLDVQIVSDDVKKTIENLREVTLQKKTSFKKAILKITIGGTLGAIMFSPIVMIGGLNIGLIAMSGGVALGGMYASLK